MPFKIHLSRVLRRYRSVYDMSWPEQLAYFQADPLHAETLRLLVAELSMAEFFKRPVFIGDGDDEHNYYVLDGTHRVCAYMLAGRELIEIEYEGSMIALEAEPEAKMLETNIDVPVAELVMPANLVTQALTGATGESVEPAERLWENLLSLRVDDVTWLTSGIASWATDEMDVMHMSIAWDAATNVDATRVTQSVLGKLDRWGWPTMRMSITTAWLTLED